MPSCHNCRHNAEIERLRATCLKCKGPCDDAHDGLSFVSLDAAANDAKAAKTLGRIAPDWKHGGTREETGSRVEETLGKEEAAKFRAFLAPFWTLDFEEWTVTGGKMRGMSDAEIARKLNWSIQRTWATWERVKARHPRFAAFSTGADGLRKGAGRKPEPRTVTQLEMKL